MLNKNQQCLNCTMFNQTRRKYGSRDAAGICALTTGRNINLQTWGNSVCPLYECLKKGLWKTLQGILHTTAIENPNK